MRISIVIPTRERGSYLSSCLDSCLAVDERDIEIVVSDNASTDNTREIVESKADPRIVYTNTGRRVSMRANFENGLNASTGEYVIFIGDDDAVLVNGFKTLRYIIDRWNPDAVGWRLVHYGWPSEDGKCPGRLGISFKSIYGELQEKNPATILGNFGKAKVRSYKDGANLYHGCVARRVIEETRARDGSYFHAHSPDVYASIVNLAHIQRFFWLRHPLTLGGESDRSNGRAVLARKPVGKVGEISAEMFINETQRDELGGDLDARVRSIDPQIHAILHIAKEICFADPITVDDEAWMRRALSDFNNLRPPHFEESFFLYRQYLESIGLAARLDALKQSWHFSAKERPIQKQKRKNPFSIPLAESRIGTVAEAASEMDRVLGAYYPKVVGGGRVSVSGLISLMGALRRAFN